jgi:hypothetical protein
LVEAAGPARRLIADRGYDAMHLRNLLADRGTGPTFVRHGGRVYYRPSDLDAWIERRTTALQSTSSVRREIIN